jgi:hypothetical protein
MVTIKAFDSEITIERFLAKKYVAKEAPTLILLAGIHGNEISGIFAIQNVLRQIEELKLVFKGNFYAISGNLNAISKGIRYEDVDLNRLWTTERIDVLEEKTDNFTPEEKEQKELLSIIRNIFTEHSGDFFFVDLHTTSSPTTPFITISDSINNRCFSANFPVPVVLGIEEYIHGPLLTYINEFGYIGIGFEAGQHQEPQAIQINEAFIWMLLVQTGCFNMEEIKDYNNHKDTLNQLSDFKGQFFEIDYKYSIKETENFRMLKGFKNFQPIKKNENLAVSDNQPVKSHLKGRIFMPLYQSQGEDGFFIVSIISNFWLVLSRNVRKMYLHNFLRILPGIKQSKTSKYTLIVNPGTAKFLTNEIFHLFGYRRKVKNNGKWYFTKRDRKIVRFE